MYIAIWCTYRTLLLDIVSTIVETLVIALHQFLYPFACDAKQVEMASLTSDTILWRCDREIWGKCRESGVMVNHLFSLIFPSTARTKSSFTTDGRPLRGSSCVFYSRTHLRTIELLMACSPYTSQSWRWISAGVMFSAFKKRITDRISRAAGFSVFLNIINTQHDA